MARAEKRKYHYIYKITCNVTNKFYIGMHSTDNLNDGYFGSGKRLWNSINYYGKENHVKEILEFLPSRQLLKEREKEIVNKELIGDILCMNLQEGGEGGGTLNSAKSTNKIIWGEQREQNLIKYRNMMHKKWGDLAIKEKMINGLNKAHEHWIGKQHTEETKQKMRKSKNVGETNSQYGTCWITKDGLNKKIKKEELDSFISNGWIKGRK